MQNVSERKNQIYSNKNMISLGATALIPYSYAYLSYIVDVAFRAIYFQVVFFLSSLLHACCRTPLASDLLLWLLICVCVWRVHTHKFQMYDFENRFILWIK